MGYLILTGLVTAIALVVVYGAVKLLMGKHWFVAWLRGTIGLGLLLLGGLLLFVALDAYSYRQLATEKSVATISFTLLSPQRYLATFVKIDGDSQFFELSGDQWQLDSRIIKWNNSLNRMGFKTGYRLDRLSGRYLSLSDEQTKERTVYELFQSLAGIDVWQWLKDLQMDGLVDARYGNSTFLPMVDGGQYQISVGLSGLLARPLNQPAKDAVDQWR
ncbi:MAG: hypothetical protein ACI82Z_001976 [Cellvibrionaceae bacterium]